VQEALVDGCWVRDIRGVLDAQVLMEYLQLWDVMKTVSLAPGVSDQHLWTPLNLRTVLFEIGLPEVLYRLHCF
jgi:hypothetical protein